MKIYIGSDHAGFALKQALVGHLSAQGHSVVDKGAHVLTPGDDYPDFIFPVAIAVANEIENGKTTDDVRGIVIGGSGQGEAIAANRITGIRAAVYYGGGFFRKNFDIIRLSREHNDANVLSFGARFLSVRRAKQALDLWLSMPFSHDPRHIRRIKKLDVQK